MEIYTIPDHAGRSLDESKVTVGRDRWEKVENVVKGFVKTTRNFSWKVKPFVAM